MKVDVTSRAIEASRQTHWSSVMIAVCVYGCRPGGDGVDGGKGEERRVVGLCGEMLRTDWTAVVTFSCTFALVIQGFRVGSNRRAAI